MESDLISSLQTARTAPGQQSMMLAVLKKNQDLDAAMAQTVAEAARPAPPPDGQGLKVDKLA